MAENLGAKGPETPKTARNRKLENPDIEWRVFESLLYDDDHKLFLFSIYLLRKLCATFQCTMIFNTIVYIPNRAFSSRCFAGTPTAILVNTLQHTVTHCNTLQHTATHCNTLQHTATKFGSWHEDISSPCYTAETTALVLRVAVCVCVCACSCVCECLCACVCVHRIWACFSKVRATGVPQRKSMAHRRPTAYWIRLPVCA